MPNDDIFVNTFLDSILREALLFGGLSPFDSSTCPRLRAAGLTGSRCPVILSLSKDHDEPFDLPFVLRLSFDLAQDVRQKPIVVSLSNHQDRLVEQRGSGFAVGKVLILG